MENGTRIDVNADLNGAKFEGAQGLAKYLHDDPRTPACLVRNVYAYGVGHKTDERDEDYLADQTKAFASSGYKLPNLMMQVASTPEFFKATIPSGARAASATSVSANAPVATAQLQNRLSNPADNKVKNQPGVVK
jgi:hypothetical protein